jgi:hypothetical protein
MRTLAFERPGIVRQAVPARLTFPADQPAIDRLGALGYGLISGSTTHTVDARDRK